MISSNEFNREMTNLEIRDKELTKIDCFRLAMLMPPATSLKTVVFSNLQLNYEKLSILLKGLKQCFSLQYIDLSNNLLDDASITFIIEWIKGIKSIKNINLSHNKITSLGVNNLLQVLNDGYFESIALFDNAIEADQTINSRLTQNKISLLNEFLLESKDRANKIYLKNVSFDNLEILGDLLNVLIKHPQIQTIGMQNANITGQAFPLLQQKLSSIPHLTGLDLSGNVLGAQGVDDWITLSSILQSLPQLTAIHLAHNHLGEGINFIIAALERHQQLKVLNLSHNSLPLGRENIASAICDLFQQHPQLESLSLADVGLTIDDLSLVTNNSGKISQLKYLDLSTNPLASSPSEWLQLAKFLQHFPSLTELKLTNTKLGDDGLRLIVALAKLQPIKILDLQANGITSAAVREIAETSERLSLKIDLRKNEVDELLVKKYLPDTTKSEEISLLPSVVFVKTPLVDNISSPLVITITDFGQAALIRDEFNLLRVERDQGRVAMATLPSMINSRSAFFSPIGVTIPAEITFDGILQKIRDNNSDYTELTELNNKPLDSFQIAQLALALQKNTNIRKAEFRNMQLGGEKLEWLLESLMYNSNLTYLEISENPLGDSHQVAQTLKRFLSARQNVKEIHLRGMQLGSEAGKVLAEVLTQTKHLITIDASNNQLNDEVEVLLAASLYLNSTLQRLELANNLFSKVTENFLIKIRKLKPEIDTHFPTINQQRFDQFFLREDVINIEQSPYKLLPLSNNKILPVYGNGKGELDIWDLDAQKCLQILQHGADFYDITLISSKQFVTIGDEIKIWTLQNDNYSCNQTLSEPLAIVVVALSRQQALTVDINKKAKIWNIKEDKWNLSQTISSPGGVLCGANLLGDGKLLLQYWVMDRRKIQFLEINQNGEWVSKQVCDRISQEVMFDIVFPLGEDRLLIGTSQKFVQFWEKSSPNGSWQFVNDLKTLEGNIAYIAFQLTTSIIVVGTFSNELVPLGEPMFQQLQLIDIIADKVIATLEDKRAFSCLDQPTFAAFSITTLPTQSLFCTQTFNIENDNVYTVWKFEGNQPTKLYSFEIPCGSVLNGKKIPDRNPMIQSSNNQLIISTPISGTPNAKLLIRQIVPYFDLLKQHIEHLKSLLTTVPQPPTVGIMPTTTTNRLTTTLETTHSVTSIAHNAILSPVFSSRNNSIASSYKSSDENWGSLANKAISWNMFRFFNTITLINASRVSRNYYNLKLEIEKQGKQALENVFNQWDNLIASNNSDEAIKREALIFGFRCTDAKKDGNCLFEAVTDQLKIIFPSDKQHSQDKLRVLAVEHIMDHREFYEKYIDDQSLENFIRSMAAEGTWGEHIVLMALCHILNINVIVINSDNSEPIILKKQNSEATIYLGYEVNLHYQSLHRDDTILSPKDNIQLRIDNKDEFMAEPNVTTLLLHS